MLLSVLIPTYNNEKTIGKAIESAIKQSYKDDYEIIVVNNASTDGTLQVAQSYTDERIKVFSNDTNLGLFGNHNKALELATGDYVIFCHSDDILQPDSLLLISERLKERHYPKKYILWGHSMYNDFSWTLLKSGIGHNTVFSGQIAMDTFIRFGGLTPSGTCYSRKSFIQMGSFPLIEGTWEQDWYVTLFATVNRFEFEMMDRLLFIREFPSTATNNYTSTNRDLITYKVFERLIEDMTLDQRQSLLRAFLSYDKSHLFFCMKSLMTYRSKLSYLIRCIYHNPRIFKHLIRRIKEYGF